MERARPRRHYAKPDWAFAPANAVNMMRQHAGIVTIASGGHGAMREAAELILAAQRAVRHPPRALHPTY